MEALDCDPLITVDSSNGVAVVTLNRPDRLNALSHALLTELREAVSRVAADENVRAVVLVGSGRMFSAGADLKSGPSDAAEVLRTYYNPLVADLVSMDKPLLCALNGPAVGAGVSLALACDMRIAVEDAYFQLAFAKVGFVPDAGSTWLLPNIVGQGRALELAMTARMVSATEALDWGLVNRVVPAGLALDAAVALADELARLPRTSALVRRLVMEGADRPLMNHLAEEANAQGEAQRSAEHAEARLAFSEKRLPNFTSALRAGG